MNKIKKYQNEFLFFDQINKDHDKSCSRGAAHAAKSLRWSV